MSSGLAPNRRILTAGPSRASGGMMALTREPSGSRASSIGVLSSIRRPTLSAMRRITRIRCSLSRNVASVDLQAALALDVDLVRAVDEDIGDEGVAKEFIERAVAEDLVHHLADQLLLLGARERDSFLPQQGIDPLDTLAVQLLERDAPGFRQIHRLDQLAVESRLQLQGSLAVGFAAGPLCLLVQHDYAPPFSGCPFDVHCWICPVTFRKSRRSPERRAE